MGNDLEDLKESIRYLNKWIVQRNTVKDGLACFNVDATPAGGKAWSWIGPCDLRYSEMRKSSRTAATLRR